MKWSSITLAKYQQVDEVNRRQLPDIDKVLYSICVLYDKAEYEIDNEKPGKVVKMIGGVQRLFELPLQWEAYSRIGKYVVNYDISKITLGQYVELSYFIANGIDKNAHYILATMSRLRYRKHSTKDHRKKADYFLTQTVEKVLGAVKAIKDNYDRFNARYKTLFGVDPEVSGNVQNDEFNKRYGWIYSATQVAAHEGIPLDQAYKLPIIQALNDLMFLKAKGKYEVEQLRKSKPTV